MMGSETIIMWNSAGLRASAVSTESKVSFFDNQFRNAKFSIAAFVETHHKNTDDFSAELGQYDQTHTILHTHATNETHSGIILLISKEYEILQHREALPGRIFNATLKKGGYKLVTYSILWPTVG